MDSIIAKLINNLKKEDVDNLTSFLTYLCHLLMKLAIHIVEVLVDFSHSLVSLRGLFKHPVEQPIALEQQQPQFLAAKNE